MGFNVTFKQNKSEKNKLTKSFGSDTLTLACNLLDNCSVQNPVLLISTNQDLFDFNYCEISHFSRQYFIEKIEIVRNDLFRVYLKCDVLSTWATEIKANTAIVKRQENNYNNYLVDNQWKSYNYESIQTKQFPNGFDKNLRYIIICNGK